MFVLTISSAIEQFCQILYLKSSHAIIPFRYFSQYASYPFLICRWLNKYNELLFILRHRLPVGDAPVRSYVPPEGYGQLDNYAGGSNQDYSNIYADSSSNNYAYGSVSGTVYADSLSGNSIDAANGESLLPAYRLPGKPDLYGLSGNSDTYVLHGQQHSTDTDSLDRWPAVSQPDNQLTQGGLTKEKKWLRWLQNY